MFRRNGARLVVAALILLGAPQSASTQAGADMTSLGLAVEAFLMEWMRGSPAAAAQRFMSTVTVQRPDILPSSEFRDASQPDAREPQPRLTTELAGIRGGLWRGAQPD